MSNKKENKENRIKSGCKGLLHALRKRSTLIFVIFALFGAGIVTFFELILRFYEYATTPVFIRLNENSSEDMRKVFSSGYPHLVYCIEKGIDKTPDHLIKVGRAAKGMGVELVSIDCHAKSDSFKGRNKGKSIWERHKFRNRDPPAFITAFAEAPVQMTQYSWSSEKTAIEFINYWTKGTLVSAIAPDIFKFKCFKKSKCLVIGTKGSLHKDMLTYAHSLQAKHVSMKFIHVNTNIFSLKLDKNLTNININKKGDISALCINRVELNKDENEGIEEGENIKYSKTKRKTFVSYQRFISNEEGNILNPNELDEFVAKCDKGEGANNGFLVETGKDVRIKKRIGRKKEELGGVTEEDIIIEDETEEL